MDQLIDTPSLLVDLDIMERQLSRMMEIAHNKNVSLRPHTKTHKSPEIALEQLKLGAKGITVATLGEAEVMRKHGITDILIAFPILGEIKLHRLKRLAQNSDVKVSLDSIEAAVGINSVGERLGRKIPIYLEVDTGLGRCGLQSKEDFLKLVRKLTTLPYIDIIGVMSHSGHAYQENSFKGITQVSQDDAHQLVRTKLMIQEELGINIKEVSVGSTPTAYDKSIIEGVTEMRPGTYVFNDAKLLSLGVVDEKDCALSVIATVVSIPSSNRFIVDAGSKTLTSDKGSFTKGYGYIKGSDDLWVSWLSEEHGVVETNQDIPYKIGDRIEIVPNHVCPAVNLADELIGIRGGEFERVLTVEGRGKNK